MSLSGLKLFILSVYFYSIAIAIQGGSLLPFIYYGAYNEQRYTEAQLNILFFIQKWIRFLTVDMARIKLYVLFI